MSTFQIGGEIMESFELDKSMKNQDKRKISKENR